MPAMLPPAGQVKVTRRRIGSGRSGDPQRRDRLDLIRHPILGDIQLESRLQVEPELRRRPNVLSEPKGRVGRDRALAVDDLVDSSRGTLIATASLCWLMPKTLMKSSMRTSPGWIGSILSVVVNDLHLLRSSAGPHDADPPLVVDSGAVLSGPITLECFEPVPRWHAEIVERLRGSNLTQLAQRHPMDPRIDRRHALKTP